MNSNDVTVLNAAQVDPEELDEFLEHAFSPAKRDYLKEYGAWLHWGEENRYFVVKGGHLAGYAAVIPARIHLREQVVSASWYIDLFVREEFRGQWLQQHLDNQVKQTADLLLGVPNELAIRIHKRNGWGVRSDWDVLMLPLRPTKVSLVKLVTGWKAILVRLASLGASLLASVYRLWLASRRLKRAWEILEPDAASLAEIFTRYAQGWVTTYRDADFIRWRYLECPHRHQLAFFAAGASRQSPSLVAITRTFERDNLPVTRLLDIFGDLSDRALLAELVVKATQDADAQGAVQINCLATHPSLRSLLKSQGFILRTPLRFCWYSESKTLMDAVREGPCHWTYADSDSDSSK